MTTRKRAAIVYSGQPRNLKDCWPNHRATFVDANPDWEIDIFAHLWFDENWARDTDWNRAGYAQTESAGADAQKQRRTDSAKAIGALDSDIKEYIREQWQPKAIRFAPPRAFDFRKLGLVGRANPHAANNALSMFYGIEQANALKQEYERAHGFAYDCVVRLRTDILFLQPVGALENYDMAKINLRSHDIPGYQIDDRFAFGESESMDKFCAVFSNIKQCARKNLRAEKEMLNAEDNFNAHEILGYHAEVTQGLQIAKHHLLVEMHRMRHFGMPFSNTPEGKEPLCRLRCDSIKSRFGAEAAARLQDAVRFDLGLGGGKISLANLYELHCVYAELAPAGLVPEKFQWAIKNALQSLTHRRGDKVPAKYLWHFYRYKLKSLFQRNPR